VAFGGDLEATALLLDADGKRAVCAGPQKLVRLADQVLERLDSAEAPRRFSSNELDGVDGALWIPLGHEVVVGGLVILGDSKALPDPMASELRGAIEAAQAPLRAAYELRLAWFRGGRMTWFALHRLVEHWIGIGRRQGEPTWLVLLGVDGLAEINHVRGMASGDAAFAATTDAAARSLSPGHFFSLPGARAAALFTGHLERDELEGRVAGAERAVRKRHEIHLRVGFASAPGADGAEQLVRRATAALQQARESGARVVQWHPGINDRGPEVLPDLREAHGFAYHGITAVWQLFDALTDNSDLDNLLRKTLVTVTPVLAAERASLWTRDDDDTWAHRLGDDAGNRAAAALVLDAAKSAQAVVGEEGGLASLAVPLPRELSATSALHFSGSQLRCDEERLVFVSRLADQIGKVLRHRETLEWALDRRRATEDRLREQMRELRRMVRTPAGLVGSSPTMREVLRRAERAAATKVPVLLTGETGTGKEVAARMIHRQSRRKGPFVVVDCGAIPSALLESELFGHEKGAFTGANSRKLGRFERARGGTLFLDEIGELPIELQPKLLRVLQESVIRRIGATEETLLDFRLIAATHRDLERMVAAGSFREDLSFRLRVIELHLPPLRERGDDVILLAYHFLRQYCHEMNRDFLPLSREAEKWLMVHSWPGNVRELQNILRRAVTMVPGSEITLEDLHLGLNPGAAPGADDVAKEPTGAAPPARPDRPDMPDTEDAWVADDRSLAALATEWMWNVWGAGEEDSSPVKAVQSLILRSLLLETGGNLARAAELLDTSPATVRSRLEKLGHPELSRSVQGDPLGNEIERRIGELEAPGSARELLDEVEKAILQELFLRCRGNKSKMARVLEVSRQTLLRRLQRQTR
jgi:DNA-binding NtrC family response regulator/GGDEF domain-containing protein